jgi:hypothetical protein
MGKKEPNWTGAVDKLLDLTAAGKVKWDCGFFETKMRDDVNGWIYSTYLNGRHIIVYEYAYKCFTDEDTWHWDTEVAIEFVDGDGRLEWQWPVTPSRFQLLDAVRRSAHGAEEFLEDFLEDPRPNAE